LLRTLNFGLGLSRQFRIVGEGACLRQFVVQFREPIGQRDDFEKALVLAAQGRAEFRVAERLRVAQLLLNGGGPLDRRREACSDAQVVFFPPTAYF
jgi:hypothetical protein